MDCEVGLMAKGKKRKPRKDEFKPVSQSFLELAWSRRPLPPPHDLKHLACQFNDWALAHAHNPPSRSEIEDRLGAWVEGWLTEENLRSWTEWMLESSQSDAQEQRIVRTMTEFVNDPLAEENPVMEFLLQAWMSQLEPDLARWAALWSHARLRECQPAPELPPEYFETMLVEAGEVDPQAWSATFDLDRFDLFFAWFQRWGRAAGWACGPDEFYEQLTRNAFESWLEAEARVVPGPELTPPQRKLYLWFYLSAMSQELARLTSGWGWHSFIFDSALKDWVLDLADALAKEEKGRIACSLLEQALDGTAADLDLRLSLAEISAATGLGMHIIEEHLAAAEQICQDDLLREDIQDLRERLALEQPV